MIRIEGERFKTAVMNVPDGMSLNDAITHINDMWGHLGADFSYYGSSPRINDEGDGPYVKPHGGMFTKVEDGSVVTLKGDK